MLMSLTRYSCFYFSIFLLFNCFNMCFIALDRTGISICPGRDSAIHFDDLMSKGIAIKKLYRFIALTKCARHYLFQS